MTSNEDVKEFFDKAFKISKGSSINETFAVNFEAKRFYRRCATFIRTNGLEDTFDTFDSPGVVYLARK